MAYNVEQYLHQPLTEGNTETYTIAPSSLQYGRHKLSVKVIDGIGDDVSGSVSGELTVLVRGIGADRFEEGSGMLDLSTGARSFEPILDNINAIQLSASGLSSSNSVIVTIASSGSDL